MHGSGVMIYNQSTKYEGNFVDGQREGKGTYYFGDGRSWEGEWYVNLQNGEGVYRNESGQKETGLWRMGQRVDKEVDGRRADNMRIE